MAGSPRISIITPSFRSGRWLKLCIASVADQGVACEHIVQDSCSDDGTQDWLPKDARVQAFIEKDRGMYDAVNRGLKRSRGEICAYLNCDEQYLPGALQAILEFLDARPEVEVAFANAVVLHPDGRYVCHRKATIPRRLHTLVSADLSFLTCSAFFRRKVFVERGLFFDPDLKCVGDGDWGLRLLAAGVPMALFPRFTSAFTETGANLSTLPNALREKQALFESAPAWARRARPLIVWHYRLRKLLAGAYAQRPFDYPVYTEQSPEVRVTFHVARPTTRWRR